MITIVYHITREFIPLTLESIESVNRFKRSDVEIKFIVIGDVDPRQDGNIHYIHYMQPETPLMHQRVQLPEVLSSVDRFIYLDSDTTVQTCISKLWSTELNGNIIGAAPHMVLESLPSALEFFEIKPMVGCDDDMFFNAGVMLVDCVSWRKNKITQHFFDYINKYKNVGSYMRNEPGLNVVLLKRWLHLDVLWNYRPALNKYKLCYILHPYGLPANKKPRHYAF